MLIFRAKAASVTCLKNTMHHSLSTHSFLCERWYYPSVSELVKLYSICNTDGGIKLRMKEVELLLFSYGTVLNWSAWGNNPS